MDNQVQDAVYNDAAVKALEAIDPSSLPPADAVILDTWLRNPGSNLADVFSSLGIDDWSSPDAVRMAMTSRANLSRFKRTFYSKQPKLATSDDKPTSDSQVLGQVKAANMDVNVQAAQPADKQEVVTPDDNKVKQQELDDSDSKKSKGKDPGKPNEAVKIPDEEFNSYFSEEYAIDIETPVTGGQYQFRFTPPADDERNEAIKMQLKELLESQGVDIKSPEGREIADKLRWGITVLTYFNDFVRSMAEDMQSSLVSTVVSRYATNKPVNSGGVKAPDTGRRGLPLAERRGSVVAV